MKPFKIPARIKIKNKVVYEIVWVDSFVDKPDETTWGECRPSMKQIALRKGQSEKAEFKTFCHEVAHAICIEREIKISHQAIYQMEDAIFYLLFHNDWS